MALTELTATVANVAALADLPTGSAAATKAVFDKAGTDIKTFINDTLLAELQSSSASANLGCSGAHTKIQDFINAVESAGSGTTPGAGIVTDAMMATDVKIGSLAALNTSIKTSITAAINEILTTISGLALVPVGGIIDYKGAYSAIPSNFALCDGTNGTPDLRNKFVLSATVEGDVGTSGGAHTKTLTTTELPAHTHTGTTASDGAHTHPISTYSSGGSSYVGVDSSVAVGTVNTGSAGAHTHTFTTASSGTGSAFDIRPAYYTLAKIMRIS